MCGDMISYQSFRRATWERKGRELISDYLISFLNDKIGVPCFEEIRYVCCIMRSRSHSSHLAKSARTNGEDTYTFHIFSRPF